MRQRVWWRWNHGNKSTIRFREYHSLTALRETVLRSCGRPHESFAEVMADLKARLDAFVVHERGVEADVTFPFFAASIEDCLAQASPAAARYRIWGSILTEVGNTADGLAAIKKLIFEQHALTWDELVAAVEAGYEGREPLRQMLLHRAPKYGNDCDEVDALAREIAEYYCDTVHPRAANPPGPGCKWAAGLMSFDLQGKRNLPASPDGRRQGDPTANSFSPCPGRDRSGPTAVLKSAAKTDLSKASHGSVLDIALHSSVVRGEADLAKLVSLVDTFLRMPATATLQMNVIDRDTLLRARADPQAPEYRTLLVRVWGFSAVFVELPPALQDHVLQRTEHCI